MHWHSPNAANGGRSVRDEPPGPYSVRAVVYWIKELRNARRERATPFAGPVVPPV